MISGTRDRSAVMLPHFTSSDRYNSFYRARVLILIRGPRSRDQRTRSSRHLDPTPPLLPRQQNLSRYNLFKNARDLDLIRGPRVHSIGALRSRSDAPPRATSPEIGKSTVEISPTRKWFLIPSGL